MGGARGREDGRDMKWKNERISKDQKNQKQYRFERTKSLERHDMTSIYEILWARG
jgi:hypothetical protein